MGHAAATAGEHAALAPAAVATAYIDDDEAVAAAKAEFMKHFEAAKAGTPIVPAPVAAPLAPVFAPGYYNGLYNGVYNGLYNGYYPHGAYGLTGYPHLAGYAGYPGYAGYAGLPYWGLPVAAAAPAAAEEAAE